MCGAKNHRNGSCGGSSKFAKGQKSSEQYNIDKLKFTVYGGVDKLSDMLRETEARLLKTLQCPKHLATSVRC